MTEITPTQDITALAHAAPEVAEMFTTLKGFEAGWRMAGALSAMKILPAHFQGEENRANCMMLLSLSHSFRWMNASPFMLAQQLVPVQGKYGWQGQFVAAVVNASKRFAKDLQYDFEGTEGSDDYGCFAWTVEKDGNRVIKGTKITWKMVKEEGWFGKSGSKWKTMPEQMFRYRAAAFFGRAYTPDLLMGFGTADELEDMKDVTPVTPSKGDTLTAMLMGKPVEEAILTPKADHIADLAGDTLENDMAQSFSKDDSLWKDMEIARREREAEELNQ